MILSVTLGGREWELKTWLGILADRTHRHNTNRNNIRPGRSIALGAVRSADFSPFIIADGRPHYKPFLLW